MKNENNKSSVYEFQKKSIGERRLVILRGKQMRRERKEEKEIGKPKMGRRLEYNTMKMEESKE